MEQVSRGEIRSLILDKLNKVVGCAVGNTSLEFKRVISAGN